MFDIFEVIITYDDSFFFNVLKSEEDLTDLRTEEREKRENRAVPNVLIVLTQSESKTHQQELLTVRTNLTRSEHVALTSQYRCIQLKVCLCLHSIMYNDFYQIL